MALVPETLVRKPEVLLVEDDATIAELILLVLEAQGFVTHWVDGCRYASEVLRSGAIVPDVIVLDLRLHDGTGLDLLTDLETALPEVPPVLLTTGYSEQDVDLERSRAIKGFLQKPFGLDELVRSVRALLSSWPAAEPQVFREARSCW